MRNADLVRLLPSLPDLRRTLAERRRALAATVKAIDKLQDQIKELERVSEVRDGVALRVSSGAISAVGDEITRGAQVYLNAHNRRTYGLTTYEDAFGRRDERFHGANFSRGEAERLAYAWVLRGEAPIR